MNSYQSEVLSPAALNYRLIALWSGRHRATKFRVQQDPKRKIGFEGIRYRTNDYMKTEAMIFCSAEGYS